MSNQEDKEPLLNQSLSEEKSTESKDQFLTKIIPFDSLSETDLRDVAKTMEWKTFSPAEVIIRQGTPGEHFYLIKSGLVKVFLLDEESRETVLGFLGEGDCFGEISLLTQGPTTTNVQTVEQTRALVQQKDSFLRMTQTHPVFYKFFNQLLTQRMRRVYKELLSETPGVSQVEPFLYRKQAKDMASLLETLCHPQNTIREAAQKMIERGRSSIVIADDQRKPQGIIRLNGIVRSTLFESVSPQASVETIMDRDFHSIDANSYFFDALHQMIKHKTHELILMEGEKVTGVLTGFDLLRFRGREVLSLLRNIDEAPTISQLNLMRGEIEKVLRALMADGALASHACKIVSEFNDKMVRRIIVLTEKGCGPPPSPYAWLGMGSEGRKEQTLLTDQDNGIIFSGPPSEQTLDYFRQFSTRVVEGLHQCGIPLCKGGVMATNPKYFGNVEQWKMRTTAWIQSSMLEDKELMDTYVFLDFRTVSGDPSLEKALRSHVIKLSREHSAFLRSLAQAIVSIPVPIGFFKNFIVEKSGMHKDELNLKLYGLVPLITCVKVLALHQGLLETNTLERIKALNQEDTLSNDQAEVLEQAFETFLTLRIRNNLNDLDQGKELSHHINPTELSTRQKQLLKEAFWAVSQLQKTTKNLLKVEDKDSGLMR